MTRTSKGAGPARASRLRPATWKGLLEVAVVAACVSTALGWLGSLHWTLDLASHFGPQAAAFGAAAAAALLIARRWRFGLLALALAAVNAVPLLPYWLPAGAAESAPGPHGPSLRVMSCNVLVTNEEHARVAEAVRSASPDVVGFIEVTPAWDAALAALLLTEYPHAIREPRQGSFGLVLMSRLPLRRAEVLVGRNGRPSIRVQVDRGGAIDVLLAHPPPPMSARRWLDRNGQLWDVAKTAAAGAVPLLVVGDLNCTAGSPAFRALLRDGGLRDSRLGRGLQPSWPDLVLPFPQLAIDHALVTPGLVVLGRRTVGGLGSDHRAIVVDVALRAPP
jgi:endonuclease/exonuclease/phosphatase (EEP) superfamily protein YafD